VVTGRVDVGRIYNRKEFWVVQHVAFSEFSYHVPGRQGQISLELEPTSP
jgi:hypothetical protein